MATLYAVTDIETTGSYAAANGITEIAIYITDGHTILESFETLINPLKPIPYYIQRFTNITHDMVADAPPFSAVAEKIYNLLHDKIFVAHNVNFDYSFIKMQLDACGYQLNTKKLCTVRLSRKIFPGHKSYSLGNLCDSLQIELNNRHRAGGDALATTLLFNMLMSNDNQGTIASSLKRNSKENMLPPHVPKEDFVNLPYTPGVYYFHNQKGKIIYVGKAKNIKHRVNTHFNNNSASRQKQNLIQQIFNISYLSCGTELIAQIIESAEIKKHWPAYNYSQKRAEAGYGLYTYEDGNGYLRIIIEKNRKLTPPFIRVPNILQGQTLLRQLIKEYNLCPKLCFLQKEHVPCTGMEEGYCNGACNGTEGTATYNQKVMEAVQTNTNLHEHFIIKGKGLTPDNQSIILVAGGEVKGIGYIPVEDTIATADDFENYIQPVKENSFIRNLVYGFAATHPEKILRL